MLSDVFEVLFKNLKIGDDPVNIAINGVLCDITDFYFDGDIMEYVMVLTECYEYKVKENPLKENRFKYYASSQEVRDELTGYVYHCDNAELVDLLNKVNNRADSNALKYYDLKKKLD